MSAETPQRRAGRRFAFGALEQLANIFGSITASVPTVGLFLPALNTLSGNPMLGRDALLGVAQVVLGFTALTALAAAVLRGLARLLEDGGVRRDMD
ncbi:MAG: hypothetical protein ACOYLS_14895 [Polymorphobacter sp.]